MTFAESVQTCFRKYADFNGVASRPEFWWFFLFAFIVALALNLVNTTLANVVSLGMLLPQLAVGARRLHDTGKSGWWQLFLLVPVAGLIVLIVLWAQPPKR
jgi:uncharacterized membrane protein YhaH (DUF805 family)